jgi:hypothetical protein
LKSGVGESQQIEFQFLVNKTNRRNEFQFYYW